MYERAHTASRVRPEIICIQLAVQGMHCERMATVDYKRCVCLSGDGHSGLDITEQVCNA